MEKPLVAILSGAGISTDSGIPDYRGPNGLWQRDPEAQKLVTYEYYMGDPEIRRRSWQMRRKNRKLQAEPNAAHRAGAELEQAGVPVRAVHRRAAASPTDWQFVGDSAVRRGAVPGVVRPPR